MEDAKGLADEIRRFDNETFDEEQPNDETRPNNTAVGAGSDPSVEKILRRYSEAVWDNSLPLLDGTDPEKAQESIERTGFKSR